MSDLAGFERAAFGRDPDRVARLYRVLRSHTVGAMVEDAARPDVPKAAPAVLATRLAAAIAAVLGDPATEIPPAELDRLMVLKASLVNLFRSTGFAGPDFLLNALGEAPAGEPLSLAAKRLLLRSLDSAVDFRPEDLLDLPPALAQQAFADLVSTKPLMTVEGQARRDRLLELADRLPPADFPRTVDHLVLLTSAWMLCSYADGPDKHRIKRVFNRTLRGMATGFGLGEPSLPAERTPKARPVLLFAAEIMNSNHVQYRYFGQYLRQLRTRFELVLLTEAKEADAPARALFDRVLTFERKGTGAYLFDIARMIAETAPDVIFWPSVGMRHWGPLFANLRLAPIQLTALGHSASTFCDTIDYYLLEEGYVSDPALFGETVVTVPDDSLIFERAPHYTPVQPTVRAAPSPLRIALPSNILKLNPNFLALVGRICAAAERPLELHLFPAAPALEQGALQAAVRRVLPNAHVHGRLTYHRYLAALSACDLVLSPFPFGGLHSVVDSLRQGLPVVAMECPEPHGRTDAMLLRRLGMPDWLIARTEDEYAAAALRVIRDDNVRLELCSQALGLNIDEVMFGDAATPLRTEVVDAVWWLYRNHERARADGRKLWSAADRNG